jgi:hypothetical protein
MPSGKSVSTTIACVGQDDSRRDAGRQSSADLPKHDLWFGLEPDGLGDPSLAASFGIFRPGFRQIQSIGNRQARMCVGDRWADRNRTIVLLAELAAILPRHPDRMSFLLRKPGVVNDSGTDGAMRLAVVGLRDVGVRV